ncbi:OmpA family protein [uncultured Algibacter sp.]|uniref:OmpA family protein n=1 Tax=uncultured Algibacter sp. TaxID=298659 RepID=UPI0026279653|nr:OmpA family protein [uncultured Algibacter sp.]
MKLPKNAIGILVFWLAIVFIIPNTEAQTKPLKRPKSKVGVSSVDTFVSESFDIYDKVYKYDAYAKAGTPLDDEDIDVLEDALDDLTGLGDSAPNILGDIDGLSILKQGKATLQMNKAKKALKYSIKTAKELLLGQRERDKKEEDSEEEESNTNNESSKNPSDSSTNKEETSNISDNIEVYSKFDFVPGDELLFFDDFSQDFIGDFPSKWNTNGSGEVVKTNKVKGNWFQLKSGYNIHFIPDLNNLPEDYTIEFDVLVNGVDKNTSSTARLHIIISDNPKFNKGNAHYVEASIPFGQYGAFDFRLSNFFNKNTGDINSNIKADIRDQVLNQPHISISVTKKRYRLWINQVKYVDIPRFVQELNVLNFIKFHINNFKDDKEQLFIRNLKVAKGGVDLRRELLSKGKVSTNGILFDSGSASIQPQSYGIIRQISQVLMQDENLKLNIIGHTDSDGNDDTNLKLSKNRADAVKEALIKVYKISGDRLQTDGKGESIPVVDNSNSAEKAKNRRVEFVKI